MRTRLLAIGMALLSASLVACGGGGGGNGGGGYTPPGPTPTPQPTATPTPKPTNNPYGCVGQPPFANAVARRSTAIAHPVASGDTFSYAGTLAQTYTQTQPCPQPTATTSAQIAMSASDSATTAPNGGGSATKTHVVETDAYPTQSVTTTTDQTVQNASAGYELYSTLVADNAGNSIATAYTSPQLLDKGPGSQTTWTNDPAAAITETLADGTHISRTVASDGTYTDTESFADGSTATITVNADGSGTYKIAGVTLTYGPPSGGTIAVSNGTTTKNYPAWFTPSGALVTDTFADNGTAAVDPNCHVASGVPASGTQIQETLNVLDPVLGYTETRVTTSYVAGGFGTVCAVIADTLKSYYDYQLDTTKIYRTADGTPNSVNAIVEYLGMTAPTSALPSMRQAQSARGISPALIAARAGAIDQLRALQIAKRAQALRRVLTHAKGAVR